MIRDSIHQEDIRILNLHTCTKIALKYIKLNLTKPKGQIQIQIPIIAQS